MDAQECDEGSQTVVHQALHGRSQILKTTWSKVVMVADQDEEAYLRVENWSIRAELCGTGHLRSSVSKRRTHALLLMTGSTMQGMRRYAYVD